MPRQFGALYTELMARVRTTSFYTLVIHFPFGDLNLSDRTFTLGGTLYEGVIADWGEIGSLENREELTLDINTVTLKFTNFPVLTTGERFGDLLDETADTVRATIYSCLQDNDGTVAQEIIFEGVIQDPMDDDFQRASMTIMSLAEFYLGASALRTLNRSDFVNLRESDIGATVPLVSGIVPKLPARITKGSQITIPVPDANNVSKAQLTAVEIGRTVGAEDWEVQFLGDATVEFTGPYDGELSIGGSASSPAIGTTSTATTGASTATSLTKSLTLSASTKVLVVGIHWTIASTAHVPAIISVTYNGVDLEATTHVNTASGSPTTPIRNAVTSGIASAIYYLPLPATGSAHNLVVTLDRAAAICMTIVGINSGSFSGSPSLWVGATNASTVSLSRASNPSESLFIDFFTKSASGSGTPLSGQTSLVTTSSSADGGLFAGASSKLGTTDTTSMGWNVGSTTEKALEVTTVAFRPVRYAAQSFTLAAPQTAAAVTLRARRNASAIHPANAAGLPVNAYIIADSGSDSPSLTLASILGKGQTVVTSTTAGNAVVVVFSSPIGLAAGNYWIVVEPLGIAAGGTNSLLLTESSTGGFSGGHAKLGTGLASGSVNGFEAEWGSSIDAHDLWFQMQFATGEFELFGSVTGFDGTGTTDVDFTSDSGAIAISAGDWQGQPAGGDRFYFSTDPADSTALLCESPAASPIQSIDTVYWDGFQIGDAAILTSDGTAGASYLLGNSDNEIFAQAFEVPSGILLKSVALQLGQSGNPTGVLTVRISPSRGGPAFVPGTFNRIYGALPTDETIVSVEIANTVIPVTVDTVTAAFSEPVVLAPGRYFLELLADSGTDATNCYKVGTVNAGTPALAPQVFLQLDSTGRWFDFSSAVQMYFQFNIVTVTKDVSIADATGTYVAQLTFDTPIPDGVDIWAGVHGITSGGELIVRPDRWVHWLLNYWDIDDTLINLDTFDATGALYPAYRFDGAAMDDVTRKELLLKYAFESRTAFGWPQDRILWTYLPTEISDPQFTVTKADIVMDSKLPVLKRSRSDVTKIVNYIDLRYQRDFTKSSDLTAYAGITNAQATISIADRKIRQNPQMFLMDFIRDGAMADDVATYYAMRLSNLRQVVEFTTKRHLGAITTDDTVSFDLR